MLHAHGFTTGNNSQPGLAGVVHGQPRLRGKVARDAHNAGREERLAALGHRAHRARIHPQLAAQRHAQDPALAAPAPPAAAPAPHRAISSHSSQGGQPHRWAVRPAHVWSAGRRPPATAAVSIGSWPTSCTVPPLAKAPDWVPSYTLPYPAPYTLPYIRTGAAARRSACGSGRKTVPTRWPATRAATRSGAAAAQMATAQPAAVARRAAVSLVAMPPVPQSPPRPLVSTCAVASHNRARFLPPPQRVGPAVARRAPLATSLQLLRPCCQRAARSGVLAAATHNRGGRSCPVGQELRQFMRSGVPMPEPCAARAL